MSVRIETAKRLLGSAASAARKTEDKAAAREERLKIHITNTKRDRLAAAEDAEKLETAKGVLD